MTTTSVPPPASPGHSTDDLATSILAAKGIVPSRDNQRAFYAGSAFERVRSARPSAPRRMAGAVLYAVTFMAVGMGCSGALGLWDGTDPDARTFEELIDDTWQHPDAERQRDAATMLGERVLQGVAELQRRAEVSDEAGANAAAMMRRIEERVAK